MTFIHYYNTCCERLWLQIGYSQRFSQLAVDLFEPLLVVEDGAEITSEANPGTASLDYCEHSAIRV